MGLGGLGDGSGGRVRGPLPGEPHNSQIPVKAGPESTVSVPTLPDKEEVVRVRNVLVIYSKTFMGAYYTPKIQHEPKGTDLCQGAHVCPQGKQTSPIHTHVFSSDKNEEEITQRRSRKYGMRAHLVAPAGREQGV